MPGIPHNKAKIMSKYTIACDKGYFDVCHPEEWVGEEQSNLTKQMPEMMEKKCSKSNSPPVRSCWYRKRMVNEEVSTNATTYKAFQAFYTACKDKAKHPVYLSRDIGKV